MKGAEIMRIGNDSICLWEKRVHTLIETYRQLGDEAKKSDNPVNEMELLRKAKEEALKVKEAENEKIGKKKSNKGD